jgi:hypothetical protein
MFVLQAQLKRLDLTIAPDGTFLNGKELYVEANPR